MNSLVRWSAGLAFSIAALSPALAAEIASHARPMNLRFDPAFILQAVAHRMNIDLRPDIAVPSILLESATPLRRFQDAIETQWRFRPRLITNAYVIARNEIYLSDDAAYYRRLKRTLDESLAHEFTHYLQAQYFKDDLTSDGAEAQAVAIQTWFRQAYIQGPHGFPPHETGSGRRNLEANVAH